MGTKCRLTLVLPFMALATMFVVAYIDLTITDWSSGPLFAFRQSVVCRTGFGLATNGATKHTVVDAKLYKLNGDSEFALLVVCASCNCPMVGGALLSDGEELPLTSQWQSGETGYWGQLKPLDIFTFTFGACGGKSDKLVLAPLHGLPGSDVPLREESLKPWNNLTVACTLVRYHLRDNTSEVALRNWVKHMKSLGVNAFRVYMGCVVDMVQFMNSSIQSVKKAFEGLMVEDTFEAVQMDWLIRSKNNIELATDRKTHWAGALWALNDCLLSSKARGSALMLFMDVDEYPVIRGFHSFSDLARDYDVVSFPSVKYSTNFCSGDAFVGRGPIGSMVCRNKFPDCSGGLGNVAHTCLGSRGRRKYIVRPTAVSHLWVHNWNRKGVIREWHGSVEDGIFIRHYQGIQSPGMVIGDRFTCLQFNQCNSTICNSCGSNFICDG